MVAVNSGSLFGSAAEFIELVDAALLVSDVRNKECSLNRLDQDGEERSIVTPCLHDISVRP